MGAHSFTASVYAESAAKGYVLLVNEAVYNHGHDPYNGTISTTNGFKMVPFLGEESSEAWMERMMDHPDAEKWGNCACTEATHVEKNDEGWPLWHFAGWAAS